MLNKNELIAPPFFFPVPSFYLRVISTTMEEEEGLPGLPAAVQVLAASVQWIAFIYDPRTTNYVALWCSMGVKSNFYKN